MKEEEEKEKLFPGGAIRTVDFIARAIEKNEKVLDTGCCSGCAALDCREASLRAYQLSQDASQCVSN